MDGRVGCGELEAHEYVCKTYFSDTFGKLEVPSNEIWLVVAGLGIGGIGCHLSSVRVDMKIVQTLSYTLRSSVLL